MAAKFRFSPCPQCCSCECANCSGEVPTELEVEVSGIDTGACEDCLDLNAVYVLACPGVSPGGGCCEWRYTFPVAVCGITWIYLRLCLAASEFTWFGDGHTIHEGDYYANVRMEGGDYFIQWYHDFGPTKPDCAAWSALLLTLESSDIQCDASAAAATLTTPEE